MTSPPAKPLKERILAGIRQRIRILLVLLLLLTLAGYLGTLHRYFELVSHFRVQYLWSAVLGGGVLLALRDFRWALVALAAFAVNAAEVLPWYFGGHRATALTSAQPLKLLLSNVYTNNQSSGPLLELIAKEDPDLIVLEEVDARWAGELRPLTKRYPVFDIVPRSDNFGIGMWTRLPNATVKEVELDEAVVSSFVARFPFRGKDVAVLGVHTVPPVQASGFELRNVELGAIAGWARSTHGNAAVLGDLNLTPFSPFHRRLVRESGLKNARQGFGIVPSWPTYVPILYIPLDQCLVSSGIAVRSIRTGPKIGSDHLPLIVELEVE